MLAISQLGDTKWAGPLANRYTIRCTAAIRGLSASCRTPSIAEIELSESASAVSTPPATRSSNRHHASYCRHRADPAQPRRSRRRPPTRWPQQHIRHGGQPGPGRRQAMQTISHLITSVFLQHPARYHDLAITLLMRNGPCLCPATLAHRLKSARTLHRQPPELVAYQAVIRRHPPPMLNSTIYIRIRQRDPLMPRSPRRSSADYPAPTRSSNRSQYWLGSRRSFLGRRSPAPRASTPRPPPLR